MSSVQVDLIDDNISLTLENEVIGVEISEAAQTSESSGVVLPAFPAAGQRNGKVLGFSGDNLAWVEQSGGGGLNHVVDSLVVRSTSYVNASEHEFSTTDVVIVSATSVSGLEVFGAFVSVFSDIAPWTAETALDFEGSNALRFRRDQEGTKLRVRLASNVNYIIDVWILP